MEFDRRAIDGDLLVDRGSATLEGVAAVAVVFILFTAMAQVATAFLAHRMAQGSVAAAATRLAISHDVDLEATRLEQDLSSTVPGATGFDIELDLGGTMASATVRFGFVPPGPVFGEIPMEVTGRAPLVVEP